MGRFKALFTKDLKVIARNRTLLVTLLLYPLIMVSVLGLVFANPDQPIPVAMVIGPDGNQPVEFDGVLFSIQDIRNAINEVARADIYPDRATAEEALRNGQVDAVLLFPNHFLGDVLVDFKSQATLTVILDQADIAKSNVAQNVITASVQSFNEQVVRFKVDAIVDILSQSLDGGTQPPFHLMDFRQMRTVLSNIRNGEELSSENDRRLADAITFLDATILELEDSRSTIESIALPIQTKLESIDSGVLEARDIVVPAAVALSVFWTGILATGSLVVYERESFAQARLNVSPVGMGPIIFSKLVVTVLIILMQSIVIIGVAKGLWDIRIDNIGLVSIVLLAGAFAAVGLGLLVAGFSRDTNGSTLLSVLAVFPMMFLSGLFFPISFMPKLAQAIAKVVPLTYAVDGLRGAMLRNYTLGNARTDLVVLLLIGGISLIIGFVRNRKLALRMS